MSFENPVWFLALLLLPLGVYFRHFWARRGSTIRMSFANWRGSSFVNPFTWQRFFATIMSASFWLGVVLLIVAQAGPVQVARERVYLSRGVDIMFVLDVSYSMAAQDNPGISRFEEAVETMRSFIQRRRNDPIGLVVFGSEAAMRVPPTLDYDFLLAHLDGLRLGELGEGTSLGMGIALATLHLDSSSASQKILIVLTDGEQNSGEILPGSAADLAAEQGIRIYTIGLGSTEEVPLEFTDPLTGQRFRGTYRGSVDEELLTRIAVRTGGQFFRASSPGALEGIFQGIDSLERVESRLRIQVNREPLHRPFLLFAFILIMSNMVLRKLVLREVP